MQPRCSEFFKRDKFFDGCPKWRQVEGVSAEIVGTILRAHYPHLPRLVDPIQQSCGKEINSSNFLVSTASGKYIVKRSSLKGKMKETEQRRLLLAGWLRRQGQAVPRVLESARNQLSVEHEDGLWYVMEYVDGSYFSGTDNELGSVAHTLGDLFGALRQAPSDLVPGDGVYPPGEEDRVYLETFRRRRSEWARLLGSEETARIVDDRWPEITKSMNEVLVMTDDFSQRRGLCHIDLHPHNLLLRDGRVRAILDFDSFKEAVVPVALAFNTFKLLRQNIARVDPMVTESVIAPARDLFLGHLPKEYSSRSDWGVLAKTEILRRLLHILKGVSEGKSEWESDISVHTGALIEAECLFSGS